MTDDPYKTNSLQTQIIQECRSMAEHLLAKGVTISADQIKCIESVSEIDIDLMAKTHGELSVLVAPATPQSILLLDAERECAGFLKFLGPVALVRQITCFATLSLISFVWAMSSPYISSENLSTEVLNLNGYNQVVVLLFLLSSSALGASFKALFSLNGYVQDGSYNDHYRSSYITMILLGMIAGPLLSILISDQALSSQDFLSKGTARPLLSIVGGFSAELFYLFLSRMTDALKSIVEPRK